MGTYIDAGLLPKILPHIYVFDFEYVGESTDLNECHLWDVGIVHLMTGSALEVSIAPEIDSIPPPFSEDFIDVTPELLNKRNAVPFMTAFERLLQFMGPPNTPKILISHNCFKSDKILLEIESKRHGIVLPLNWFFFDSLMFARKKLPKRTSYTLNVIHNVFGFGDIVNQHFALADAFALRNIIIKLDYHTLSGPIYPPYCTSLQAVKWLGPSCEYCMLTKGIKCVEQLMHRILNEFTQTVLRDGCATQIKDFIEQFIVFHFDIKQGNAKSIASSLVSNWLTKL